MRPRGWAVGLVAAGLVLCACSAADAPAAASGGRPGPEAATAVPSAPGDPSTPGGAAAAAGSGAASGAAAAVSPDPPASPSPPDNAHGPREPAVAVAVGGLDVAGAVTGLAEAPVVVEYPVQDDRAGVLAVRTGGSGVVGPVRSATPSDAALAVAFDADLVAASATTSIVRRLDEAGLAVVEEHQPGESLTRDPRRRAPHNLYASPAAVHTQVGARPPTRLPWAVTGSPAGGDPVDEKPAGGGPVGASPIGGDPVEEVAVAVTDAHTVIWTWDGGDRRWLRTGLSGVVEQAGGARVGATTVVVLEVAPRPRPAVVADLTGVGPAVVLADGRRYRARWERSGTADPPTITARDGTPLTVATGTTWLQVCAAPCAQQVAPVRPPR